MILSRAIFIAQLVLMLPAFALLLVTPASLNTILIYFYLVPVGIAATLFALWRFARHPAERRLAAATLATPIVCLGLPMLVYSVNGGPVTPTLLVAAVLALLVFAALLLLGKTAQFRGTGLFASKRFNVGCLVALCALLLMLWFPIVVGLAASQSIVLPTDIADRDRIITVAALYLLAVAIPASFLSLFMLLYAPVGLFRNRDGRVIHLGQLITALVLLATLASLAMVGSILMVNPG
jgi:hypothetical protein